MALRHATSRLSKTIACFASKDATSRFSSSIVKAPSNIMRTGLSSARSFNQTSIRGSQLPVLQPLQSRAFTSVTPDAKTSSSSSSSSSSSLPLPALLAPLLVTGTVALLLHSNDDTLDTPNTVITSPKPKPLTSHEMGELAREEQLDQQILKSLMEDLRKEDEHEAWVESVQAYGKLSRALASSPRGSAEAFHYATLKEKMDDQAYENWCAGCRDYERTARLDAIKNGPAADAPFHEFMLEARQQEEDARLFDGMVLEPLNMTKIDLVALQAGERAVAWAREREEAAVYNDAITREYEDEKFLASVLDCNGKKLVYTHEGNDEASPAQELNGIPEPLEDVYTKEMRDEAFTARWVGGAAA